MHFFYISLKFHEVKILIFLLKFIKDIQIKKQIHISKIKMGYNKYNNENLKKKKFVFEL